jgi:hypothetical protein
MRYAGESTSQSLVDAVVEVLVVGEDNVAADIVKLEVMY